MKSLIIIPAFNEETTILKTYQDLINNKNETNLNYDIIVINDGSTDNTEKILADNNIKHITLIENLGIGGAVQTGYKYAYNNDYDAAIQFDADGQHNASYIKELIDTLNDKKVDFVVGSRFVEKKSKFKSTKSRRMGINILSFFIKFFTGKKIYDVTSGFRIINKKLIKLFMTEYPTEYPEPVTNTFLLKHNFKYNEIAVEMNERQGGVSSIRAWKNVYFMLNVLLSIIVTCMRRYNSDK